jgi:hypothetical protein
VSEKCEFPAFLICRRIRRGERLEMNRGRGKTHGSYDKEVLPIKDLLGRAPERRKAQGAIESVGLLINIHIWKRMESVRDGG